MKKNVIIVFLYLLALLSIVFCITAYSTTVDHRKKHLMPKQEFRKSILRLISSGVEPVIFVTDTKEILKEVDSSWVTLNPSTECKTGIIIDFNFNKMVFSVSDCNDVNNIRMMKIEQNDINSDEIEIAENLRKGILDQSLKIGIFDPSSHKRYLATLSMKDCNNFFIELVTRNSENVKMCDRYHIVQINSLNIIHRYKF